MLLLQSRIISHTPQRRLARNWEMLLFLKYHLQEMRRVPGARICNESNLVGTRWCGTCKVDECLLGPCTLLMVMVINGYYVM